MLSQRFSLVIILVCSALFTVLSAQPSLELEVEALKAFKKSITSDPYGALADWTSYSNHHCIWSGVVCDPSTNRFRLVGSIPASIGKLGVLQVLDLSQNQLSGVLPRELGNLSNLESLLLFRNSFVGNIPHELGRCKKLVNQRHSF
ncbi:unnamed protein product [Prunus armeniaca]|uniref:Leucine-rich repeat-containing N-terminal plant-type domain-containing protein n=1 Tax=Prunus armeniaca TaxID=36596 RepID=A0A6J5X3A8_PRUAR|nr:unnamed protein product [Prunus armeniaca]